MRQWKRVTLVAAQFGGSPEPLSPPRGEAAMNRIEGVAPSSGISSNHSLATDETPTEHGRDQSSICMEAARSCRHPVNSARLAIPLPSCPPSVFNPCFIVAPLNRSGSMHRTSFQPDYLRRVFTCSSSNRHRPERNSSWYGSKSSSHGPGANETSDPDVSRGCPRLDRSRSARPPHLECRASHALAGA